MRVRDNLGVSGNHDARLLREASRGFCGHRQITGAEPEGLACLVDLVPVASAGRFAEGWWVWAWAAVAAREA